MEKDEDRSGKGRSPKWRRMKVQVENDEGPSGEGRKIQVEKDEGPKAKALLSILIVAEGPD